MTDVDVDLDHLEVEADRCRCGTRGLNDPDPPYHCATCCRTYKTLAGFDDHRHEGTLLPRAAPKARQRASQARQRAAVTVKSVRL